MNSNEYDGLTGASLIGNRPLKSNGNVDAKLIDAGYQVRIDSAMEDDRENRAEVIAPLTHADAGRYLPAVAMSPRFPISSDRHSDKGYAIMLRKSIPSPDYWPPCCSLSCRLPAPYWHSARYWTDGRQRCPRGQISLADLSLCDWQRIIPKSSRLIANPRAPSWSPISMVTTSEPIWLIPGPARRLRRFTSRFDHWIKTSIGLCSWEQRAGHSGHTGRLPVHDYGIRHLDANQTHGRLEAVAAAYTRQYRSASASGTEPLCHLGPTALFIERHLSLVSVAFGWIPDGMSSEPAYPAEVSGGKPSRPDTAHFSAPRI